MTSNLTLATQASSALASAARAHHDGTASHLEESLETASTHIADLCENLTQTEGHAIEGFDIRATATQLLAIAEKHDVMSTFPASEQSKHFWIQNRDFLRGLADVLDQLPTGAPLTRK